MEIDRVVRAKTILKYAMNSAMCLQTLNASRTLSCSKTKKMQEEQILVPLGVGEMAIQCNSFTVVPKPNGTV